MVAADSSRRRHTKRRWQLVRWCHFVFWSSVAAAGGHVLYKKLYVMHMYLYLIDIMYVSMTVSRLTPSDKNYSMFYKNCNSRFFGGSSLHKDVSHPDE